MKTSGPTQVITDFKETKRLAEKLGNENYEFRRWLKFNAPANIDEIVSGLSRKYFFIIDCKKCGDCCLILP